MMVQIGSLAHGLALFSDELRGRSLATLNAALMGGAAILQIATGRLVANLAHEIRNPVANLRNLLELIRRRATNDVQTHDYAELAIDERCALGRASVCNECLQFDRRREEAPEIQIGAACKRGIANQLRLGNAMLSQIRGDKPINRRRPAAPGDIGHWWAFQRQRRLPLRTSGRRRNRFPRPFRNPRADDGDFSGRQRRQSGRQDL